MEFNIGSTNTSVFLMVHSRATMRTLSDHCIIPVGDGEQEILAG